MKTICAIMLLVVFFTYRRTYTKRQTNQ